jgi:hypothetical protein
MAGFVLQTPTGALTDLLPVAFGAVPSARAAALLASHLRTEEAT